MLQKALEDQVGSKPNYKERSLPGDGWTDKSQPLPDCIQPCDDTYTGVRTCNTPGTAGTVYISSQKTAYPC